MSDDDLIRRCDALRLVEDYETIHDRISMLPRADLAQAPAPVRVKALQWIAIDDDDCEVEAYAAGFRYWVFKSGTEEFTLFLNAWEKGHYPTLEAAKAAAQADYEARILAAQTTPDAGVVAELVEALRLADAALSGANMNIGVVEKKVKAALALIAHNTTEG